MSRAIKKQKIRSLAYPNTTGLIFKRKALRASTPSSVAMRPEPARSAQARCSASPARSAVAASSVNIAAR